MPVPSGGSVTVDGSQGEGGGQILRTSLSLAALTGRPLEINRIRAGRTKPGLQPQHLAAVRAAAALCAAATEGADVGSTRLRFLPQAPPAPGRYHFDIGTAGAATLVLQTVLLPLALAGAPSTVTVTGGTHVPHAPTAEYLSHVFGTLLGRHGLRAAFQSPSAGFYPGGGGTIVADITPIAAQQPVSLLGRDKSLTVTATVLTARLPADVASRGAEAVRRGLHGLPLALTVNVEGVVSPGPGAAVVLVAEIGPAVAGFSAVGARGRPMEAVAEEACAALRDWYRSGAACDEHLADQLTLPMALVDGESRWTTPRVTDHLRTVLPVIGAFLPVQVTLDEPTGRPATVTLRGAPLPPWQGA